MKKIIEMKISTMFFLVILFVDSQGQTVKEQIEALNIGMEKSFIENDMMKIASLYADSALISGSGRMNIYGRNAIDHYWTSMKGRGISWKLEIDSVEEFGLYVLQRGKSYLAFKGSDGSERQTNVRFFIIWLRTGDSYKIMNDIFTRL